MKANIYYICVLRYIHNYVLINGFSIIKGNMYVMALEVLNHSNDLELKRKYT